MLTTYRRHTKSCPHRAKGRKHRNCACPVWADGLLGNKEIRKSVGTRDWTQAQATIQRWEARGEQVLEPEPMTVTEAWEKFLADAKARKLCDVSLSKYGRHSRRMVAFAQAQGFRFLRDFNLEMLRKLRESWPGLSHACLKTFYNFAHDSKWIGENPAKKLKNPKKGRRPTMPFTQDQMTHIFRACETYGAKCRGNVRGIRAFVYFLRYSGLRISDAATLERSRISGDKLFLYTAKTGTPVWLPLPLFVLEALAAVPKLSERYFFWTGDSRKKTLKTAWEKALKRVFRTAGIPDGHAHRFRDTFAVELLLVGVPIKRVSILLGHSSVKVTEEHYAPWVLAEQEQLEADVRKSWDPPASAA